MARKQRRDVEVLNWDEAGRALREPHWTAERDRNVGSRTRLRPKTEGQAALMAAIEKSVVTVAAGPPGTGKTYLACGVAAQHLRDGKVDRIIVARPLLQCDEDLGTLPGTLEEKMGPYVAPLMDAFADFFSAGELVGLARDEKLVICPLAVMRGRSFKRTFMVLDEAANCTLMQLRMFLTRFGEGSKAVVSGDLHQSDLCRDRMPPLFEVMRALRGHPDIGVVQLTDADVVRHPLVGWIDERLWRAEREELPPPARLDERRRVVRISSPWRDYYDIWADGTGPVLHRAGGHTGPHKAEQFRLLEAAGWLTPPHGLVGDVMGEWWEAEQQRVKYVVAYTDPMAHCAEGKRVYAEWQLKSNPHMGMGDRYWKENQLYCSAFVGCYPQIVNSNSPAVSLRRLQIGRHVFWVEYRSATSWMSNDGDGSCEVVGVEMDAGYHPHVPLPLFAVDFVIGREMYAIDFNTAPGVRGSGVEKVLCGREACAALEKAVEDLSLCSTPPTFAK